MPILQMRKWHSGPDPKEEKEPVWVQIWRQRELRGNTREQNEVGIS